MWERVAMCVGCAVSTYKVTGVLEHHHILPLALDQPSLLLGRPLTTPPLSGMCATPGRKGLAEHEQGGVFDGRRGF